MRKLKIFSVGTELPCDNIQYVDFNTSLSFLDADIILFTPELKPWDGYVEHAGKHLVSESSSVTLTQNIKHWHDEIGDALNVGKIIIIFVAQPYELYKYTGQSRSTGTGRSAGYNKIVTSVNSYDSVPFVKVEAKSGTAVEVNKRAAYFQAFWKECAPYSTYEGFITGPFSETLLTTKTGDKIVGAIIRKGSGAILFIPPINYDPPKSKKDEPSRATLTKQFWKRFESSLIAMATALMKDSVISPPPSWSNESIYSIPERRSA